MSDREDFEDVARGLLGDRDIDDDQVKNFNDCRPLDSEKQDIKGGFKTLASKVKSGAQKLKSKYGELKKQKEHKEAREKTKEGIKERFQRRKELKELQKEQEELEKKEKKFEEKKKVQEKKKELEQKKKEVQGSGAFEKIGNFLDSLGAEKRASNAQQGSVDSDDKWAVVHFKDHTAVATFHYKSDAKDYISEKGEDFGVMRTKTALNRGYQVTSGQAYDIFGSSGGENADDVASFVLGAQQRSSKNEGDELDQIMKDVIG